MKSYALPGLSLALSCVPVGGGQAVAQEYTPGFDNLMRGYAMTELNNATLRDVMSDRRPRIAQRSENSPAQSSTPGSEQAEVERRAVQFSPSASRRRANLAAFVEKSRAADSQGAAAMEKLFAQSDIIESMQAELLPYGLRTDNLADAYTVWWMNAWQAAHGDTSDPTREQAQAVKAQATRALLATPKVASATDAQKQEFAEALLVQAALIGAFQAKYKNDADLTRKLATSVRQGAKATGLDLDAMTLTANGFVPAGL